MKTVKTIFALITLVTVTSTPVWAAPGIREVRSRIQEQERLSENRTTIDVLRGARTDAQVVLRGSQELSRIASGRADQAELAVAIRKSIVVKSETGDKTLALNSVAQKLLKLDQTSKQIREMHRDLTTAGKNHLKALDTAVEVGAEFLSLASRTSAEAPLSHIKPKSRELNINAFNKQLSILMELGTMETADLISHTEVMKAAVARKTGPRVNGDIAFRDALYFDIAKGNTSAFVKKIQDLLKCI